MKTYIFDLDGTLCEEAKTFEKALAKPKLERIALVNKLYSEDNRIIIYTARGWAEYKITEYWLQQNNVKYNLLMCGKPIYDIWVDDRAFNDKDFFKDS